MEKNKDGMANMKGGIIQENSETKKDMSEELANLNKKEEKPIPVIKIKDSDIELIKAQLDITYEDAKTLLIKSQGDVNKVIDNFLQDFCIEEI